MTWHEQIKEARAKSGLTQKAVAETVGITTRGYQMIEAGSRWPQFDVLLRICEAIGLSHIKMAAEPSK